MWQCVSAGPKRQETLKDTSKKNFPKLPGKSKSYSKEF